MPQDHSAYYVGHPLPLAERMRFADLMGQTGGAVDLPRQTIFFSLPDYRPSDADDFRGPARMRVSLRKNFMIISPAFRGYNFDLIWSPAIAKASDEPPMERFEPDEHPIFNFILTDETVTVRGIRVSSITPAVGTAINRAQAELLARDISPHDLQREMMGLFGRYPKGLPDGMFHEICELGD